MRIYHGTTETVALLAMQQGISPRSRTGHKGNWEHTVDSHPEMVYLTSAYAPFFAMMAAEPDEFWGIVEVETDKLVEVNLLPDEDYLAHKSSRNSSFNHELQNAWDGDFPDGADVKRRAAWFRERLKECTFAYGWEDSIREMGNCAHEGVVPAHAITRVAIFDPRSNPCANIAAGDPSVSIMNYKLCGHSHREITKWFMKDPYDLNQIRWDMDPDNGLLTEEQVAYVKDEWSKRDGVQVISRNS
jgi:hypothetical protein